MNINQSIDNYQQFLSSLGQGKSALIDDGRLTPEQQKQKAQQTDFTDKVTLSYRAAKMQKISAEFFSGTISSSQIPALTQRLYEDGFLTDQEFNKLGGQTQKVSAVSEASSFINRMAMQTTDKTEQQSYAQVADVLANIDIKSTPELRKNEAQAFEFISLKREQLEQQGAAQNLIDGFKNVEKVLGALDKVRKQEQSTGALSSYAQVQEAIDKLGKLQ